MPSPALGVREREQQLATRLAVRAVRPKRLERHLVETHSLLVGEQCDRAPPGPLCVLDRLAAVAPGGGLEEMVRQLSEVGLEVRGVEILESLSDLPMEL